MQPAFCGCIFPCPNLAPYTSACQEVASQAGPLMLLPTAMSCPLRFTRSHPGHSSSIHSTRGSLTLTREQRFESQCSVPHSPRLPNPTQSRPAVGRPAQSPENVDARTTMAVPGSPFKATRDCQVILPKLLKRISMQNINTGMVFSIKMQENIL